MAEALQNPVQTIMGLHRDAVNQSNIRAMPVASEPPVLEFAFTPKSVLNGR